MIYEFPITTTTGYTETSPKKTTIVLARGIIHQLDIISDEAAKWTLYVAITHGLHQIYPTNTPNYFNLRGEFFSFRENYELYVKPLSLSVYSYLVDADYEHKIIIRIGLLTEEDLKEVIIKWKGVE